MHPAFYVVLGHAVAAVFLGWLYFRHYQMTRSPIGVFNLVDVVLLLAAINLIPFLYLMLPLWFAASLLTLVVLGLLYFTWEPVLRTRRAIWLPVMALLGADIGTALLSGVNSAAFFAINNIVMVISVVGATNLWAQSGMKARDLSVLAGALVIYDFIATIQFTLMDDLIARLAEVPLAPMIAWNTGDSFGLGIGLGDMLMATVFPLVMRKAFGRTAGIVAMALALGALGTMLALLDLGVVGITIPAMVVLGPLILLQYAYCRGRQKYERTTWQYLQAEPLGVGAATSSAVGATDLAPSS